VLLGQRWHRVDHGGCVLAVGQIGGDGVHADRSHTVEAATDDGGEGEDDVMECDEYHGLLHELQGR
jgi:hypothetical protein